MAIHVFHPTFIATGRFFIKVSMTKKLAMEFSWSGMGPGRIMCNNSFQRHRVFDFFKGK